MAILYYTTTKEKKQGGQDGLANALRNQLRRTRHVTSRLGVPIVQFLLPPLLNIWTAYLMYREHLKLSRNL